jgi:hypothetical protein
MPQDIALPHRPRCPAELVATHRLDEDEAVDTITTPVRDQPRKVFEL